MKATDISVAIISLQLFVLPSISNAAGKTFPGTWTNASTADIPADFAIQGEFVGEIKGDDKLGCQVIALGQGAFQAVVYPGGLPGDGWDGENKILMDGLTKGDEIKFQPATGNKRYVGDAPAEFSATSQFPPVGQRNYSATLSNSTIRGTTNDGKPFEMQRTVRKSPTLGATPPESAIVLFDGTKKDEWEGGRLDEMTRWLNTDGSHIRSKRKFHNYTLHLEFMVPFRPAARHQERGNSGVYQNYDYEIQVLDSFGLEGLDYECGGIYSQAGVAVNMCYPPLTWQTYDIDLTNAVVGEDGRKKKNAVITVRHNGVVIHNQVELPKKTPGSRGGAEGTPGPLMLQGHGNPLQYRNIWIVERD